MEDFTIVEAKATLIYQPDEGPSNIEIKLLNGVICVKKVKISRVNVRLLSAMPCEQFDPAVSGRMITFVF
jgi:hypothetical protein